MKPFPANILLVGFSEARAQYLCEALANQPDYKVFTEEPGDESRRFEFVFAEIGSDERTALSIVERFKALDPNIKIILFSSIISLSFAVPLVRAGAWTVVPSQITINELIHEITSIQTAQNAESSSSRRTRSSIMVGESEGMQQLMRDIKKAAPTNARVLITGENGVGKELVARALHDGSVRADKPFVEVNCAAIPRELIESELFGYEKGAFTGAIKQKKGLIELAHTGTLFLDEIGDMALDTQVKVLRVLQENQFMRVGGDVPIPFDVRIISATNKNLRDEIENGRFRKDLFFRINVIPLHILPLRERVEDILPLFAYFQQINNFAMKTLSPGAEELMRNYIWPGNVRELNNLVERISAMIPESEIAAERLLQISPGMSTQTITTMNSRGAQTENKNTLRERMDGFESEVLQNSWEECKGNISEMARQLSTDRANLHRKLRKYGIH